MGRFRLNIGLRVAALVALLVVLATGVVTWAPAVDRAEQTRRQEALSAALTTAANAIVTLTPFAWDAAFPVSDEAARSAWHEVYVGLARYRWQDMRFVVTPLDENGELYAVDALGTLAGDRSRLVATRDLRFSWAGGSATLVADTTPPRYRRLYLLAFSDPVVLRADHLTVVGDRSQRRVMRRVVAADAQVPLVAGEVTQSEGDLVEKTLVAVCATRRQAQDAGASPGLGDVVAYTNDGGIYVIAPYLSAAPGRSRRFCGTSSCTWSCPASTTSATSRRSCSRESRRRRPATWSTSRPCSGR